MPCLLPSLLRLVQERRDRGVCVVAGEGAEGGLELLGAEGPSSLLSGLPAEIRLCEQTRRSEGR